MVKYINADALMEQLYENCETTYQGDSWYGKEPLLFKDEVIQHISQFPAADVRPNVRGEWVIEYDPETEWYRVTCSECGEDVTSQIPMIGGFSNAKALWNYCPNCGADMRGKSTRRRKNEDRTD